MAINGNKEQTISKLQVVREYKPVGADDTDTRLSLVFAPWIETTCNAIEYENGKEVYGSYLVKHKNPHE